MLLILKRFISHNPIHKNFPSMQPIQVYSLPLSFPETTLKNFLFLSFLVCFLIFWIKHKPRNSNNLPILYVPMRGYERKCKKMKRGSGEMYLWDSWNLPILYGVRRGCSPCTFPSISVSFSLSVFFLLKNSMNERIKLRRMKYEKQYPKCVETWKSNVLKPIYREEEESGCCCSYMSGTTMVIKVECFFCGPNPLLCQLWFQHELLNNH